MARICFLSATPLVGSFVVLYRRHRHLVYLVCSLRPVGWGLIQVRQPHIRDHWERWVTVRFVHSITQCNCGECGTFIFPPDNSETQSRGSRHHCMFAELPSSHRHHSLSWFQTLNLDLSSTSDLFFMKYAGQHWLWSSVNEFFSRTIHSLYFGAHTSTHQS